MGIAPVILLDTHVLVWTVADSRRLSRRLPHALSLTGCGKHGDWHSGGRSTASQPKKAALSSGLLFNLETLKPAANPPAPALQLLASACCRWLESKRRAG